MERKRANMIKHMGQNGNNWIIWVKSGFCSLKTEIIKGFKNSIYSNIENNLLRNKFSHSSVNH